MPSAKAGYTLFELIIVSALIILICTLSTYFMRTADSVMVRRDLDRMYALMIFMQRKAQLEGKPCHIIFDYNNNLYKADQVYTLSSGVTFGAPNNILGPPSRPRRLIQEPGTWAKSCITFYQNEMAGKTSAGAIYLTDLKKSCLYALTCDASCVTHIRRYRYEGRWIPLN